MKNDVATICLGEGVDQMDKVPKGFRRRPSLSVSGRNTV